MISLPKLALTVFVVMAVIFVVRWLKRPAAGGAPPARSRRVPRDEVIDLERNPDTGAYEPRRDDGPKRR